MFRKRIEKTADLLVVGLGNPGAEYEGTRHNVGTEVIAELAIRNNRRMKSSKERALVTELKIESKNVVIAIPQTFMNLSGESVRLLVRRYHLDDLGSLVVVHDELDLPVGKLQVKQGGGLAGHNGLKSIKQHLGTEDFSRVRIGVGRPSGATSGSEYVLKRPGKKDREDLDVSVHRAADAIEVIAEEGITVAMNRFNTGI